MKAIHANSSVSILHAGISTKDLNKNAAAAISLNFR